MYYFLYIVQLKLSLLYCFSGPHCEVCAAGYFGDAKNGGKCEGTVSCP